MIRLRVNRFLLHKADAQPGECEDAVGVDATAGRFAVVDGATEGFDSRRWARYLAHGWIRAGACDVMTAEETVRRLGGRLQARHQIDSLPWYLQERAHQGAFAAFIGLSVQPPGTWDALALGDACLFQEGRSHFLAFPLTQPEDFRGRPLLVPSRIDQHPHLVRHVRRNRGLAIPGDCFLLMSDAIACWYLAHARREGDLHGRLHQLMRDDRRSDLEGLVTGERAAKRLRNDDVAMLRIEVLSF